MKAVVLAAGEGRRLQPFTKVLPKPLLPLGDRPMLDITLRQLAHYGFTEINVTASHLRQSIKMFLHMLQPELPGVKLNYIEQDKLMGTAGGISSIPGLDEPFLVMNGDLLTTLNFANLMRYHLEHDALLTISQYEKKEHLSLGLLETDENNNLVNYLEKPERSYPISMGIYIYDPSILERVPANDFMDLPTLAMGLVRDGKTVVIYPFDGHWIDIGKPEDFADAQKRFEERKNEFLPFER
jgi:NDP-mannose synthase